MNIINPKVEEYLNGFYMPLSDKMADFRKKSEEERVPIILKDTETFLGVLLKMIRPARILEIGTAVGYSASFFALTLPEVKITTIEREETSYKKALNNINDLGLKDRIECRLGDAVAILEQLSEDRPASYDLLFIDAGKSHYSEFLEASMKLLDKKSVVVCDNILMKAKTVSSEYDPEGKYKTNIKRMRAFVDELTSSDKFDTTILSIGDGVSLSLLL